MSQMSNANNGMRVVPGRRLAAMMFTDVAGYSRLMQKNERATHSLLEEHNAILRDVFPTFGGREIRTIGDAFFVEFPSAVDAVQCAYQIQQRLYEWNLTLPRELLFRVRIGVHVGDIIDAGDDAFGNDVNISARIEGLADAGGICVSQQALDHVQGKMDLKFKSKGLAELKNISGKVHVHSVVLPWLEQSVAVNWVARIAARVVPFFGEAVSSRDLAARALLGSLVFGLAAYFAVPVARSLRDSLLPSVFRAGIRAPMGHAESQALNEGWSILVKPRLSSADAPQWEPFNPSEAHRFADRVKGEYWLKNEFVLEAKYEFPAVVLGLIPERHRVYLNDTFIGGTEHQNPISYYSFDPKLVQAGSKNTILVKAYTQGALRPGLSIVPRVGAAIGELDQIGPKTRLDLVLYHNLRLIYLSVTAMFFLGFMLFYAMNPVSRQFLYYGLYSLLGCILLLYHNPLVSDQLDYQSYSFLKAFALCMSGIVLSSGYFALRGNRKAELRNNLAATLLGFALIGSLLGQEVLPSQYQERSNFFYILSGVYSFAILGYIVSKVFHQAKIAKTLESSERWNALAYDSATLTFMGFNALFCLVAIRGSALVPSLPSDLRQFLNQAVVGYPVFFATSVWCVALIDYTLKNHALRYRRRTDDLVLRISKEVSLPGTPLAKLETVHALICQFLGVSQSSVYQNTTEGKLGTLNVIAPVAHQARISREVGSTDGIIGYVLRKRTPVLIRDISKDLRFRDFLKNRSQGQPFTTLSCMVFPLQAYGKCVGVITFSEKRDGQHFNRQDFQLVQVLINDLVFLVSDQAAEVKAAEPKLRSA